MIIKAAIIDFDGTITTRDMSDFLAGKVGKEKESAELNQLFWEGKLTGLTGLMQRINFLHGITTSDLRKMISDNNYLRPGALELFKYCKTHDIITIIASGSIVPFLEIYKELLDADYIVGSKPKMDSDTIDSISVDDYSGTDFKIRDSRSILDSLNISADSTVAIGDSPADKGIFEFSAVSIGVNPKPGMEEYIDYSVYDTLADVLPILESFTE